MCLCKPSDSGVRAIFWPQGSNLNDLGKGLLKEATYQISKGLRLPVSHKIFMFFPVWVYEKQVTP